MTAYRALLLRIHASCRARALGATEASVDALRDDFVTRVIRRLSFRMHASPDSNDFLTGVTTHLQDPR
jgi:hypothetical protein